MKQVHPIPPLYSNESEILILGSFPSVKSRETAFFYGHPQNRFWRVISEILNEPMPSNTDEKRELILKHKIALWDVIAECEITGSADSSIKNVIPNDLNKIIENTNIKAIFVNGKTAEKYYIRYTEAKTGIKAICLPSTSPANASYGTDRLKEEWSIIKDFIY